MDRYSIIKGKNPREIALLRGSGCRWKQCTFCDYHIDKSADEKANYSLNSRVLERVTGQYGVLEIINSGSFSDLDKKTVEMIQKACKSKNITQLHVEYHWIDREKITPMKQWFSKMGIDVKVKMGVETFDIAYREQVMKKGMGQASPEEIAIFADEVCLLFGLEGQTATSMETDVEIGLSFFERVCINIMTENTTEIKPCRHTINLFTEKIYGYCIGNPRIDVLMENTEFGVGGTQGE